MLRKNFTITKNEAGGWRSSAGDGLSPGRRGAGM